MKHISQLFSAAIIMIVCFLSVTHTNAQTCPNDIAPTNVPWQTDCRYYQMTWPNGNTCETWICVCYRTIQPGNKKQIYIAGIGYSANCAGDNHTPSELQEIFERASELVLNNNEIMGECPPCGSGTPPQVIDVLVKPCAEEITDSNGNKMMQPCPGLGYCKRTYSRCCDPISGVPILTLISAESTGTCDPNNTNCKSICY